MTRYLYPAVIRKESGSDFGVEFPDLPGCFSVGDTLTEAMDMASEALALHLEGMIEESMHIPRPSDPDVFAKADDIAAITIVEAVLSSRPKAVKVSITLPEDLLAAIAATGQKRSTFIAEAVRRRLGD